MNLNRRDFLKKAITVPAAIGVAATMGLPGEEPTDDEPAKKFVKWNGAGETWTSGDGENWTPTRGQVNTFNINISSSANLNPGEIAKSFTEFMVEMQGV